MVFGSGYDIRVRTTSVHELTKRHYVRGYHIIALQRDIKYEITIMHTDFQKLVDLTLANVNGVFVYIDDILIVTKGTKQDHVKKVSDVMKVLDDAN